MFGVKYIEWINSAYAPNVDTSYETPYMAAPCPFCGNDVAFDDEFLYPERRHDSEFGPGWRGHCIWSNLGCGTDGPQADTEYEALLLWNSRGDRTLHRRAVG